MANVPKLSIAEIGNFSAVLKEADGMFQFEVIVVLIGLRSETNLLHLYLHLLCLLLLGTFLQLIKEL